MVRLKTCHAWVSMSRMMSGLTFVLVFSRAKPVLPLQHRQKSLWSLCRRAGFPYFRTSAVIPSLPGTFLQGRLLIALPRSSVVGSMSSSSITSSHSTWLHTCIRDSIVTGIELRVVFYPAIYLFGAASDVFSQADFSRAIVWGDGPSAFLMPSYMLLMLSVWAANWRLL